MYRTGSDYVVKVVQVKNCGGLRCGGTSGTTISIQRWVHKVSIGGSYKSDTQRASGRLEAAVVEEQFEVVDGVATTFGDTNKLICRGCRR